MRSKKKSVQLFTANRTFSFILIAIFITAFFLRFLGIIPGYPNNHPDESTSYGTAIYMFYNFLSPDRYDYPAGVPFLHLVIYSLFILPSILFKLILLYPTDLSTWGFDFFAIHRADIFGPNDVYALFWSRGITAAFGFGAVVMIYLAAKELFNKYVGLFAALFLAVNYLHVVRSHFGLPDVHSSFFVTVTLFACALLLKKPTRKRYMLGSLAAAMLVAMKYQVFGFLPLFVTHISIAMQRKKFSYLFNIDFLLSLLAGVVLFFLINPFYVLNLHNALSQNTNDVRIYQMGILGLRIYPYFYLFHWGIGSWLSLITVFGFFAMAFKETKKWLIVSSFAVPFFFFMTYFSQGGIFSRNFANVMSYVMLYAGYMVWIVWMYLQRFGKRKAIIGITCIVLFVSIGPLYNSIVMDVSLMKPWNNVVLGKWLSNNLPTNVQERQYQLFLPASTIVSLQQKRTKILDWDYSTGPNNLAEFQKEQTDFAIFSTYPFQSITYWWRGWLDPMRYLAMSQVPFAFIQEGFYGLSIRELMPYTVYEVFKPWQAHNEHNFLVYKLPKRIEKGKPIKHFSFNSSEPKWQVHGTFGFAPPQLNFTNGMLRFRPGEFSTSRVVSPFFPIKTGKTYTVEAKIKTEGMQAADPFVRMDFYSSNNPSHLEELSMSVAISDRATESGVFKDVSLQTVAPKGAKYATVSFQQKNPVDISFLSQVAVFENHARLEEVFPTIPYITPNIPLESIYYNSFL